MLLEAIGAVLPAAMAVALSPFPVIGIVLILAGAHGRRGGALFALGWVVGLTVVSSVIIILLGGADDPDTPQSAIADWSRVVLGAAMIVVGARKWWSRPRGDDLPPTPGWMASLDQATPSRALVLGLLLAGANPKNFILSAAASASIVEAGLEGNDLVLAALVFVVIGSCTVVGAVIARVVGGHRGVALLESVRQFMVANSIVITVIVLLILGAKVLGDGLAGLGR